MGIQKDKLSDQQKNEVERLRQFAVRNRFELKMNSTRWRAAIDALLAFTQYSLGYRVKCITDKQEPDGFWRADFPAGLPLYNAIEWLEVEFAPPPFGGAPAGAARELRLALPEALRNLGRTLEIAKVPFNAMPQGLRIVGYTRT